MAPTNHERIGRALKLLHEGLLPYFDREMKAQYGMRWSLRVGSYLDKDSTSTEKLLRQDLSALLRVIAQEWNDVFGKSLGKTDRNLLFECRDIRNTWAHSSTVSSDDTERALDSIARLLSAVSAPQSETVAQQRFELLRLRFDEQTRHKTRRVTPTAGTPTATLKPWREIATPHPDVASGNFQQAEFAADLWEVYLDRGSDEYRDPTEFYRRTYLTDGLRKLLSNALKRLSGRGGDPVIELQTNFGGGKTHAMLALYHLCNVRAIGDLPGMEDLFNELDLAEPPQNVNVAVLVGNKIQPSGITSYKPEHDRQQRPIINTLWGELAWQLGGADAYELVRSADETATNPGDTLTQLFDRYSPCLILIDEWVAYARQLHEQSDLAGGSFDTQFTFAQTLSESAKNAKDTLLAVSIPASDIETGGDRGKEALERLKNAIGRVESPWRPASAEESFEIVRRRLFQIAQDPQSFSDRDVVIRQYLEMYRTQKQEFPSECSEKSYEERMRAAYPIHPELFDRLYSDWSSLDKFQRTRGVLRLMAKVIYHLWNNGDANLLIAPGNIPMGESEIQSELTRYLEDQWLPIIDTDVEGPNSLPQELDNQMASTLGRYSASRRVARAIYIGSAPTLRAANRGIDDRRIKLACVQPGEITATFSDALRRLSDRATYLYVDSNRYWISTQPNVNRTVQNLVEQILHDEPHRIEAEIVRRLKQDKTRGDFQAIHIAPSSTADIPDASDLGIRLVVLSPDHPHQRNQDDSRAITWATQALNERGSAQRHYKNTLIFLAADKGQIDPCYRAIATYLAWDNIIAQSQNGQINLDNFQRKQAKTKLSQSNEEAQKSLQQAYIWAITPTQSDPQQPVELNPDKLQGSGEESPILVIDRRVKHEDNLQIKCAPASLNIAVLNYIWKQHNHISTQQLWENLTKYIYCPRLKNSQVLLDAIAQGVASTVLEDNFAFAEGFDEKTGRYLNIKAGETISPALSTSQLIVKPDVAAVQLQADRDRIEEQRHMIAISQPDTSAARVKERLEVDYQLQRSHVGKPDPDSDARNAPPTRFYGSIAIDPDRATSSIGQIAEAVLSHLTGIVGAEVEINIDIQARVPDGIPDDIVRTVTENCNTLKFKTREFES